MITILVFKSVSPSYIEDGDRVIGFRWIDGESDLRIGDEVRVDGKSLRVGKIRRFDNDSDASDFVNRLQYENQNVYEY